MSRGCKGAGGRAVPGVRTPPQAHLDCFLCCPPVEKVDNTLTLIILSVVGGVIGLIVLIMVVKKLVLFILKKTQEKK